jgi:hypothetical protein
LRRDERSSNKLNIAVIGNLVSPASCPRGGASNRRCSLAEVGERRGPGAIECGSFIAALRRKIGLSWHPERLATADKTR